MATWMPIKETNGIFEVSDCGQVRRVKYSRRRRHLGLMKQQVSQSGYMRVCLRLPDKTIIRFVHRLVTIAFINDIPDGMQVNHVDGVKANNSVSNLEIVTAKENSQHASRIGLKPSGDSHYASKDPSRAPRGETVSKTLTELSVRAIRELYGSMPVKQIAQRFSVTPSTVCKVGKRQSWRHVQ